MNAKRVRAVIVTIALIVATNFAISRAESVYSSNHYNTVNHIESAAKSNANFASDASIPPTAPRPTGSLANDASIPPTAPRPS